MDKLCCCLESDLPDISVNVNCACCESRVEERVAKDTTDSDMPPKETDRMRKEDDKDETSTCCCFRRKRHAKSKNEKERVCNGRAT